MKKFLMMILLVAVVVPNAHAGKERLLRTMKVDVLLGKNIELYGDVLAIEANMMKQVVSNNSRLGRLMPKKPVYSRKIGDTSKSPMIEVTTVIKENKTVLRIKTRNIHPDDLAPMREIRDLRFTSVDDSRLAYIQEIELATIGAPLSKDVDVVSGEISLRIRNVVTKVVTDVVKKKLDSAQGVAPAVLTRKSLSTQSAR